MKLNVDLLRRVRAQILAEPERFRMESFISDVSGDGDQEPVGCDNEPEALTWVRSGECGMACCIGGWALALSGLPLPKDTELGPGGRGNPYWYGAARALGLPATTEEESIVPRYLMHSLCLVGSWPTDLSDRWEEAQSDEERARIGAERIDRFIAEHAGAA